MIIYLSHRLALISVSLLFITGLFAQHMEKVYRELEQRGEIYLEFEATSKEEILDLSKSLSIDKIKSVNGKWNVLAYLNRDEFENFRSKNINYDILTPPSMKETAAMCSTIPEIKAWNCYPLYDQYVSLMQSFEEDYPGLCKLYEFGQTIEGRKLLAIKLSDNVSSKEEEPEFLYTSSMHGDEVTGYVLMLRLIDYLLANYNVDSRVAGLLDNTEIWINPLANPDGTYSLENNSVYGATRGNSNNIDLNRNFPNPPDGAHASLQLENVAMINFLKSHNFTLAANFHGGEEVVNYPWDNWTSAQRIHADDEWYQEISHEYADTVHANSLGYLSGFDNGVTNGGDWYTITGGRQDYMNYFMHSREVTIEISSDKMPSSDLLPSFWNYNYRSFLNYIERVHTGVYGKITDQFGNPLKANVFIGGHDFFNSDIYSDTINGMYYRMMPAGTYHLIASLAGYDPAEFDVIVPENSKTEQNIVLQKWPDGINPIISYSSITNPVSDNFEMTLDLNQSENLEITIFNLQGKKVLSRLERGKFGTNKLKIPVNHFKNGIYIYYIKAGKISVTNKFIKL